MNDFTSCVMCHENVSLSDVLDTEVRGPMVLVHYKHGFCGAEGGVVLSVSYWDKVRRDELVDIVVFGFADDLESVRFVDDLEGI